MASFTDKDIETALLGRQGMQEYPFPGLEGRTCSVRALSETETDKVRIEAVGFCKENQIDLAWDPEFLDRVVRRFTVLHAVMDPQGGGRFFKSQADIAKLDTHVVTALYELYLAHKQAIDPLAYASEEEVTSLVEALKKGLLQPAALSSFDRPTQQSFLITMAYMLFGKLPTSK